MGLASKIGKLGTVVKLEVELLAHDATAAAASQLVAEGKVDAKSALVNAVAGKVVGDIADNVAGKSADGKVLAKQANRIERVAANNPRASRTKAAKEATQKAANYVERKSVAASTASSGVAGNIATKVLEEGNTKKQK